MDGVLFRTDTTSGLFLRVCDFFHSILVGEIELPLLLQRAKTLGRVTKQKYDLDSLSFLFSTGPGVSLFAADNPNPSRIVLGHAIRFGQPNSACYHFLTYIYSSQGHYC
jgi:hypothetical protein